VKQEVAAFRERFTEMGYCFSGEEMDQMLHWIQRELE
jgi:hypothetical protein